MESKDTPWQVPHRPARPASYADLLELPGPEESGGLRFELLDGELLVTRAPALRHQRSVMRIAVNLIEWTDDHGGEVFPAPTACGSPTTRCSNPTCWSCEVTTRIGSRNDASLGHPTWWSRCRHPRPARTDLVRKRRVYEREGVAEFWFVDLDVDQVQCYRLGQDGSYGPPEVVLTDGQLVSAALPGCAMPAADALQPPGDS